MDILQLINKTDKVYDLVVAADVFIYIGHLSKVFSNVRDILKSGALFCFSIELNDDKSEYILQHNGRFCHSLKYIHELAKINNLEICASEKVVVRMEQYKPVDGQILVLMKK